MSAGRIVRRFQYAILTVARWNLGRPLTEKETAFVASQGGLFALEMNLDAARVETPAEIERFLNSE